MFITHPQIQSTSRASPGAAAASAAPRDAVESLPANRRPVASHNTRPVYSTRHPHRRADLHHEKRFGGAAASASGFFVCWSATFTTVPAPTRCTASTLQAFSTHQQQALMDHQRGKAQNQTTPTTSCLAPPCPSISPEARRSTAGKCNFCLLARARPTSSGLTTILYDTARNAIRIMPTMFAYKWQPMSDTVNGSLYIMGSRGSNSFEVLYYGQTLPKLSYRRDWHWHSLPPPPYIHDDEPVPGYDCDGVEFPKDITATAVVGNSCLWISTAGVGSFSFDTLNHVWSKLPGGQWALPFSGRAEYVADYNLWFGLSCQGEQLCASDLATVSVCKAAPALLNAWDLDLGVPPECIPGKSYMVYLGDGKFFIAKMFHILEEDHVGIESFAVLMGVEVERSGGDDGSGRGLRMIKHRSKRHDLNDRKTIDLVI